ncbi:diacylglycerol kinase (ATP) [Mytilus galloprovincialis]|nr:diacylglycerol kinase (ATP) [Mytilus galloprovincialis]
MDPYFSMLIMISFMVFAFILMKIYRRYRLQHYEVPARDVRKGHRWYMVDIFPELIYCSFSHDRIKHGARCDSCGLCVDESYMKAANKKFPCKPLTESGPVTHHHWIQGNLPLYSKCFVCGDDCGILPHISDVRCAWCGRSAHENCIYMKEECDMGEFRSSIVPPHCIKLTWTGIKGRRHLVVESVNHPGYKNWSPVIVVGNRKSGNNEGELILRDFRSVLNPTQVIDLNDVPPENGLEWCHLLPDITFRVLVCGGDGSVGWVLNAINHLQLKNPPLVAILPLGTGNDLSRVLGWGEGHTMHDMAISTVLHQVEKAEPDMLDRWNVQITRKRKYPVLIQNKSMIMNNYASIGVDALVTLNFHKQRESRPWLFTHRLINKLCYLAFGTKDVVGRECCNLHKKIKLELDGRVLHLPDIEGVVILNIPSWGGGCQPWGTETENGRLAVPSYNDGLLEVMGLYSSFHIAQLQVGLAQPLRLGQAKKVKITILKGKVPMQVDGEPWEQSSPVEIEVTHHSTVRLLSKSGRQNING